MSPDKKDVNNFLNDSSFEHFDGDLKETNGFSEKLRKFQGFCPSDPSEKNRMGSNPGGCNFQNPAFLIKDNQIFALKEEFFKKLQFDNFSDKIFGIENNFEEEDFSEKRKGPSRGKEQLKFPEPGLSTFNRYSQLAQETCFYPRVGNNLKYATIGFAGEVGEVCNEVKKSIRDDGEILTKERQASIADELGDCLWYLNAMCLESGNTLAQVARDNITKVQHKVKILPNQNLIAENPRQIFEDTKNRLKKVNFQNKIQFVKNEKSFNTKDLVLVDTGSNRNVKRETENSVTHKTNVDCALNQQANDISVDTKGNLVMSDSQELTSCGRLTLCAGFRFMMDEHQCWLKHLKTGKKFHCVIVSGLPYVTKTDYKHIEALVGTKNFNFQNFNDQAHFCEPLNLSKSEVNQISIFDKQLQILSSKFTSKCFKLLQKGEVSSLVFSGYDVNPANISSDDDTSNVQNEFPSESRERTSTNLKCDHVPSKKDCPICLKGSIKRKLHKRLNLSQKTSSKCTLCIDLSGPLPQTSQGYLYCLVGAYLDHQGTRPAIPFVRWLYDKSAISCKNATRSIINEINSLYAEKSIFRVHSDRGGEFLSKEMSKYLDTRGIFQTFNEGDDSRAVGVAERCIGITKEGARNLLVASNLSNTEYWPYAMNHAAFLRRIKLLEIPVNQKLIPFGSPIIVRIRHVEGKKNKSFSQRGQEAIYLGSCSRIPGGAFVQYT